MADYPDFVESTGYGTGEGLCGWNCYHSFDPFFPGISERTYTDEQLEEMNKQENTPKEYAGRQYTAYEARQEQRRQERNIRAKKQKLDLLKFANADEKSIQNAEIAYRTNSHQYAQFSKAMGLPQERERINYGLKSLNNFKKNGLTNGGESGIMETERAISFKKTDKAIDYAKNKLALSATALSELPVEKVNAILSNISRLYAEMPMLKGFVNEVLLEPMSEVAKASIKWVNGTPLIRLKLSQSIFSSQSLEEIETFVYEAVKSNDFSPKNGLHGLLKHEFAHFAEYFQTLKKYNYSQQNVASSLDDFELAKQIKNLALKNCELDDNKTVIANYLSTYAFYNPSEFVAEAYSSIDDNKLVNEVKRILKKKWGI